MKVFAFALLLLVAVTYGKRSLMSTYSCNLTSSASSSLIVFLLRAAGEALQCQNCVREAPDSGDCVETVETCAPEMNACAKISYPAPYGKC